MSDAPGKTSIPLEAKVGAFVVALLGVGALLVFLLGSRRGVFEQQVLVHAFFDDVEGLREGAPVRLAGVAAGTVSRIDFVEKSGHVLVRTDLHIARARFPLVRTDSVARIDAQGLLGDKIVEISVGTPSAPALPEGGALRTVRVPDMNRLMSQTSEVLDEVKHVAATASRTLEVLSDPQAVLDLRASFSSLRHLMEAAEHGPGLAHALFYDRDTAHALHDLTGEVDSLVGHIDHAVAKLDLILRAVDGDGAQVVNNVSRAARSLGETANLLDRSQIIPQLARAATDLAAITRGVRSGQGSLGALVVDSTAYEQLVTVLGGVERSRILRALVRWAISKDEGTHAGRVIEGPSPPPPPKR